MSRVIPKREKRFMGLPISEGVALARVNVLEAVPRDAVPFYVVGKARAPQEKARLQAALEKAAQELDGLVAEVTERIGLAQANIFVAQKMMLVDPVLVDAMFGVIDENWVNAEAAVLKSLDQYESLLLEIDNEYLKDRASDVGEIGRRLLDILYTGESPQAALPASRADLDAPCIVVAAELTPSETVALDTKHVAGFITERGGPGSHAAILARALGIPAVSGIKNTASTFAPGDEVLLNGTTGEVFLSPSQTTLRLYPTAHRPGVPHVHIVGPVEGLEVLANINRASEAILVREALAEGVGLYRTEFETLAAGRLLSEDEQYERVKAVVETMEGRPVYVRLLDLGGDKAAPFLELPSEENPCLGFRGARLLLGRPELLITQARAIARASIHGPIHVIYPMIVDLDQFLKLREIFRQNVVDIDAGELKHGVMFEVPSACLMARELLDVADFGSIGSNDLIQYLFAVDRNNDLVAADYGPDRPSFWTALRFVAKAAQEAKRPLSLCGEMGGQPKYLPRIMEAGIRTVSVNPRLVGLARMTAKRIVKRL